ncbi:hypothetical protein T265_06342 [Opisthorchis viverrini]|uniref:Uncharacterized protein n=1 Tax=Opisthorchis viverrini TaxID=6198 RepID=A0A074ZGV1_OPIVI|nr:hypothetical protein T265_06342 [Opisthorchis viverrini]KER26428.1 hypothetical protein T265_06342 [Opisthorchis viverrini]
MKFVSPVDTRDEPTYHVSTLRDISNSVPTETRRGLVHHVQLLKNIINERFNWVPAVAPFRCLAAMPHEGGTRARILPGSPSLDRGSREAEVEFEPRTFRNKLPESKKIKLIRRCEIEHNSLNLPACSKACGREKVGEFITVW